MFTTLFLVALFLALFQIASAQGSGFVIDTPALVQCQSVQLTWTSTLSPPYDLLVVPSDDVCGESIEDLGYINDTSLTWNVNIAAGTQVVLSLQDSAGNEAWSGSITVGGSSDTSCLHNTSSISTAPTSTPTPSHSTTHTSASPSSSLALAGAANAGIGQSSGAFSMRPPNAAALVGSAMLALVVLAL